MRKLRGLSAALTGAAMAFTLLGAVAPAASATETLNLKAPAFNVTPAKQVVKEAKRDLRKTKHDLRAARKTVNTNRWSQPAAQGFFEKQSRRDAARQCLIAARSYGETLKVDPPRAIAEYVAVPWWCPEINDLSGAEVFDGARLDALEYWGGLELPSNLPTGSGSVADTPAQAKRLLQNYPDMPQEVKDSYVRGMTSGRITQIRRSTHEEFVILLSVRSNGQLSVGHTRGGRGNVNLGAAKTAWFAPGDEEKLPVWLGVTWSTTPPEGETGRVGGGTEVLPNGLRWWYGTLYDNTEFNVIAWIA
jgi:hypothetical protein